MIVTTNEVYETLSMISSHKTTKTVRQTLQKVLKTLSLEECEEKFAFMLAEWIIEYGFCDKDYIPMTEEEEKENNKSLVAIMPNLFARRTREGHDTRSLTHI